MSHPSPIPPRARMRNRAAAACLTCLMTAPSLTAQPTRVIPGDLARQDAALARRAIELIHPGLHRYTTAAELDSAFDEFEAACTNDVTEREFYAQLSLVLARIRCGHTKAEPSKAWAQWRAGSASYLPFRFDAADGRMVVTQSACAGLNPGDQVVSINGVAASVMMATILAAVPADGWTDGARRYCLGAVSDLDECEFDHFLPAFHDLGPLARLEVRRGAEESSRVVEAALMTQEARRAALAEPSAARNLDEAVSLRIVRSGAGKGAEGNAEGDAERDVGGAVGVLSVGTFVAYRKPIDPEDVYRPVFERLAAESVHTLILDLRANGGGSDEAAVDLGRFLIAEPFTTRGRQWVRTYRFGDLADQLETWDRSVLNMPEELFKDLGNGFFEVQSAPARALAPLEPVFRGTLIVLCGPGNASGATLFLAGLRERRDVTLVGEPTGGSVAGPTAGIMLFLPLPNTGIRVRIPAIRSVTGIERAGPEGGVEPDVLVRPDVRDRLAGRDTVLETALGIARRAGAVKLEPHER